MKLVRTFGKITAWLLGAIALLLAAWLGINATDEALSEEARAAMATVPLPPPDRENAFLDFLVLGAPASAPTYEVAIERLSTLRAQKGAVLPPTPWGELKLDPRLPQCAFGAIPGETWKGLLPCVEAAASVPQLTSIVATHDAFLRRYRAMRDKPRFVNIIDGAEDHALPSYRELLEGQRLTILLAAGRFKSGDRQAALRELEKEMTFYRRMLRDATMLIDKMIALVALDRASLFAVELARHTPRGDRAVWRRLERALSDHTHAELDLSALMRRENANRLRWLLERQNARLADPYYAFAPSYDKARWWDAVMPYLYRPNQTVNWLAGDMALFIRAGERPSPEWASALKEAREQAKAREPGPAKRVVFNPVGWNHPHVAADYGDYAARLHARANIQALARLIVKLREAGISKSDEVEVALAGPLGKANADPFNGERFRFDPRTRTIGFEADSKFISGGIRPMRDRYGRMALPL
jgi:hypothetical protein